MQQLWKGKKGGRMRKERLHELLNVEINLEGSCKRSYNDKVSQNYYI